MSNGTGVAIVSVIVTALATGYGTYMQYLSNEAQQEKIIELETYKQANQIELLETKAKIERFNEHCLKIEQAIKDTSQLLINSSDEPKDWYGQEVRALTYSYLLSSDARELAMKSHNENKEDDTSWATTMLSMLQIEYGKCIHSEF
ncbi:TPA: hypothetical protein GRI96_25355 [Vibrio parahaemolyticus]|uniref:hypothetical protein n=1 Tax=Vibrio parahaemolyticus TaxID=670 RepID=UPI00064A03E2|nr:hypothetical protein [Vibrio parahaemolyticus]EII3443369.1 hypothetical protein [Vibrio parahaemolyticus]ELA7843204.1 hypothetical protein [Vibrio parahaemolyticus]OXD24133.1 hypothetical protein CA164_24895 [Vibrio parahaemolyticus]HAS6809202.1 hypothetical protein [Vibrio parahaemolyticus]HAS6824345.1 hypothetical protein [Vibrio parahaemolyticus]